MTLTLEIRRRGDHYEVTDSYGAHRFSSTAKSDCFDYASALIHQGKAIGVLDMTPGEEDE